MKRARLAVLSLCSVSATFAMFFIACGGDDSVAVNGTDGGGDATTTTDGSSGFDSSVGDTGTKDSGGGTDASTTDAGDAAVLLSDAGSFTDSGPGGDAAVLNCGGAACSLPDQECCLYDNAGDFSGGCANGAGGCPSAPDGGDAGDAAVQLDSLGCEVAANCPGVGKVCCITRDTTSGTISSQCSLEATCVTAGNQHRAQLCDPSLQGADAGPDASATGCLLSECSNSNISTWYLPNGFGTCGGVSSN